MTRAATPNPLLARMLAESNEADAELLRAAADYYHQRGGAQCVRDAVRRANRERGVDFATGVLYTHFAAKLRREVTADAVASPQGDAPSRRSALMLAIAPGAFHREHPEAGGDGRLVQAAAERHGWDCERIPTESLGTLDLNARIVTEWLEKRSDRRIVLVSLSKGTSDVMVALARRPDLADVLAAWVSVSGILLGTMMANWLLDRKRLRPVFWMMRCRHRADIQAVRDLRAGRSERLPAVHAQLLASPVTRVPTFHLAGFPLRRHLSCMRARIWRRRFRRDGPNDSVVMLEDLLGAHGTVIPVWGADHYLRSSWDPAAALAAICHSVR